jgi:poly(A) polymerase
MKAVKHIDPPEWMIRSATEKVMRAIGGYDNPAASRFVGGCVRDELLHRPVHDIDIATIYTPDVIASLLEKAGIKNVPTGIDHGTLTAVCEGKSFEITTLRRDIETDGRRAVVGFTQDWSEDAQRRDFTVNTLLAGPDGSIYDPTGQGLTDLENRHVAFVGEPVARIREDYLRILRFFRFHAQIGQGAPDRDALEACRIEAGHMGDLSRERITQEMFKLLSVPDPSATLIQMLECGVLVDLPGEDFKPDLLLKQTQFQNRYDAFDLSARLFVLAGLKDSAFEKYLVLSNAQKKEITILSRAYDFFDLISEKDLKILIYRYKNRIAAQILLLKLIEVGVNNDNLILLAKTWPAPEFPVTGDDLMKQGFKAGPELGRKLQELEEAWIANGFTTP